MGSVHSFRAPTPDPSGRVPPHDLEAERAVIDCVVDSSDVRNAVLPMLQPEHFFDLANGRVWQVVQQLAAERGAIDIVTVKRRLRDLDWPPPAGHSWGSYLDSIARETPAVTNPRAYAEIVIEKWRLRQIIATCQRVAAEGYASPPSLELAASLGVDVRTIAHTGASGGRSLDVVGAEVWNSIIAPTDPSPPRWPWPSLHHAFGPLVEREVTYLCARPEAGKTSLSFQAAEGIAAAEPDDYGVCEAVLYFSLEMDRAALFQRQLGIRAGVPARLIRERVAHNDGRTVSKLIDAQKGWATLPIIIEDFDGTEPTIERLEALIVSAKEALAAGAYRGHNGRRFPAARLRTVMIDHFGQIRSPAPHNAGMPEKLGETAKALKGLVKRTNVHGVIIAHAGTRAEDRGKDLTMKDVFGSSGPERYADAIIFMTRPEEDRVKLVHAKSRGEGKATAPVFMNFGAGRVWEEGSSQ